MPKFHYHPHNDIEVDLPALLARRVVAQPDATAIVDIDGELISYAEFQCRVDAAAGVLATGDIGHAVSKGDRVALFARNGAAFAVLFYAVLRLGATVVPINTLLKPLEIAFILQDSQAVLLLHDDEFEPVVAQIDSSPAVRLMDADLWRSEYPDGLPIAKLDAGNDVAVIIYTSGTTGQPKGAMLTHRNIAVNTWSGAQVFALQAKLDRILVVLPMFHSFAGTIGMHMSLLYGATMLPMQRFEPSEVAKTIARLKATLFLGVPSMYNLLLRLPEAMTDQLASLRLCVSGGAALPVEILTRFEARFGVPILEGDGPTECSPLTCMNPLVGPRKPGTVGLPVAEVEMSIRDEQGNCLANGEVGEICVRGPNIMKGYLNRPDDTADSFFDDWFRTGDLGSCDDDGYFAIVDRLKDMIIVNGMNVYPRMIEEVLYRHPAVLEAAAVGEPHDLHGEIPVAYVVVSEAIKAAEIRSWSRQYLGPHQAPRRIELLDALPKGATGKILKRELRKHGEIERGVKL